MLQVASFSCGDVHAHWSLQPKHMDLMLGSSAVCSLTTMPTALKGVMFVGQ